MNVLQKLHDALLAVDDDQQRVDLLRNLDRIIDRHLPLAQGDIIIPSSISRGKGRPKTSLNKRLPSKFEIKEKEDSKGARKIKTDRPIPTAVFPDASQNDDGHSSDSNGSSDEDDKCDDSDGNFGDDDDGEDGCMSSAFVFYQGSKRKDLEIDYLQKAKR